MSEDPQQAGATRRNRSIRLAVVTSVLSKGGTALLQLLAIPLAVHHMGRAEFGIYTSISLALSTVALLQVGVGPALAHGLSKASDDPDQRARLASSAFFLMTALALLAGIALAAVLMVVPIPNLFGSEYAGLEPVMRPALWLGLGLFLSLFLLNLTDRVREGLLEVAHTNLWGAAGNVTAAIAVAVGVLVAPRVWFLVLAIHGSVVLAKLGNTLALWRKNPEIIPRPSLARRGIMKHLFGDGLAFSSCCLLAGVVEYNLCGWFVGRVDGPSQVALYGVFVSLSVMQLGFVMMLTTPTWPAVAEALARGDLPWARRAGKKLYLYGAAFGLCAAAGLIVLGPWALELWLGEEFADTSRWTLAAYALYFAAHVWRHVGHSMMIGTGQVTRLARVQFIETGLLAIAAWIALNQGGMTAMLTAMGLVIFAITGWTLPKAVWEKLNLKGEARS